MKKILAVFFLFVAFQASAQKDRFPVKGQPVKVKSWGSLALILLSDSYFNETRDSLVLQIGRAEFDSMKVRCSMNGWPNGVYGDNSRMDGLKVFKIAAVTHVFNGQTFERYAVLRVPYPENKDWDPALRWEQPFYFLVAESALEPLSP